MGRISSVNLRRQFLEFFKERGHVVVPSSGVAPRDDPSLLFVNAGMNQFKDVFTGASVRDYSRATSVQKCIRVGGKHNDLEQVGHTTRHLTFFEMLGNFSFGDYFKSEAIAHAWKASIDIFQLDGEKIWASVFREDDEAFELWKEFLPEERIVRLDERDNFWTMGETGPCGPCSELLYDRGKEYGSAVSPYEDPEGERYPEFWNLVFMAFDRQASGKMTPLPKPSIDTGAGLERILALQGGYTTLFETDVLQALIRGVEEVAGSSYGGQQIPFHVVADHVRSLSFAIADGVQPSNVDRGYVLRKILRRAVRYGRQLGIEGPFLGELVPLLVDEMGEDYPELVASKDRIIELIFLEEEAFCKTLRRGGNLLGQVMERARAKEEISGEDAFKLKDTYGLPVEEVLLMAHDGGLSVDLNRYEALELEAKERSKQARKEVSIEAGVTDWEGWLADHFSVTFTGYETLQGKGRILGLLKEGAWVDSLKKGEKGGVVVDQTPFYAEKGGQVGDQGSWKTEKTLFSVVDVQNPYPGVVVHLGRVVEGTLQVEEEVEGGVDPERREGIAAHHTATHLLHWALEEVLGPHVQQAGSVVEADRLRFDFTHHKSLSKEELRKVEDLVNEQICANQVVATRELDYAEVQADRSVKQFFGDKYDAKVRMVAVGPTKELCGGTHASQTGVLGMLKVVKEGSIAAGIRRIEAVVGLGAVALARGYEDLLEEVAQLLEVPVGQVLEKTSHVLEEHSHYAKEMRQARKQQAELAIQQLVQEAKPLASGKLVVAHVPCEPKALGEWAEGVLRLMKEGAVVLGVREGERCALMVALSKELVSKGLHAGHLVKEVAPLIGGGGGGRPERAQAGGVPKEAPEEALEQALEQIGNTIVTSCS